MLQAELLKNGSTAKMRLGLPQMQRSRVGNVGVALPPTAEGVMMQAASGNGYIGYFDGGAFGIPILPRTKKQPCFGCNILGKMKFKLIGQLLEEGLPKQHILIQKL